MPFGIDSIESQRRLSRARWTGHDRDRSSRDLDVESFEVVLAGAADDDAVLHTLRGIERGSNGDSFTVVKSKRQTEDTPNFATLCRYNRLMSRPSSRRTMAPTVARPIERKSNCP